MDYYWSVGEIITGKFQVIYKGPELRIITCIKWYNKPIHLEPVCRMLPIGSIEILVN